MNIAGYEWSESARVHGKTAASDPNIVGTHLELLRKNSHGELTPEDVLRDAASDNSPLHAYFEWSDTEAARQYRLQQARGLIRAVVAIYTSPDKPAQRMRAFVHIPERGAEHYRDTAHAMSQERTRDLVLQQAWREFQSWRKRYKDLDEFAKLFAVADRIAKKLPTE